MLALPTAMKLFFVDSSEIKYHVATPYERPLGGSQSALCYLATELARRGHEVNVYTWLPEPLVVNGVRCFPANSIPPSHLDERPDAVVFLNGPAEMAQRVRSLFKTRPPLVLWTGHDTNQPAMLPLAQPEARLAWDAIVCVSDWHRESSIREFGLDPDKVWTIRNAIAPAFHGLFASADELARAKSGPPVLAYTSTPYRGLGALLAAFPRIRAHHPDAELRVYSSMAVYQAQDDYRRLYEACHTMPGVTYVGSLPQPQLAAALREASFLAYPNLFRETYCTAAAEALAAGLHVITAALGALPETTAGYATLIPPATRKEELPAFAGNFAAAAQAALARRRADPAAFAAERFQQVQMFVAQSTWSVRAAEWENTIARLRARQLAPAG